MVPSNNRKNHEPNKDGELGMGLGLMKRWAKGTKFVYEAAEGPDVRLAVVRLLKHKLWGHVVGRLSINVSES